MSYGAWYLNTKLWRKHRADEPLIDPKVLQKAQDENVKKEIQKEVCQDFIFSVITVSSATLY